MFIVTGCYGFHCEKRNDCLYYTKDVIQRIQLHVFTKENAQCKHFIENNKSDNLNEKK